MVVVREREERLSDLDIVLFIGEDAQAGYSYLSTTYGRILSRRITQWTGDRERSITLTDETLRYAVEHTKEYHPGTKMYFWLREIAERVSGVKRDRKSQQGIIPYPETPKTRRSYLDNLLHSINNKKVPAQQLLEGIPSRERTFLWIYMNNDLDLEYVHSILKRRNPALSDRDFARLTERSYFALVKRYDALYR